MNKWKKIPAWKADDKGTLFEGSSPVCTFRTPPDQYDLRLMKYAPLWPDVVRGLLIQGLDGPAANVARLILTDLDRVDLEDKP